MNLNKLEDVLTQENQIVDKFNIPITINDIVIYTTSALFSGLRQGVITHINEDGTVYVDTCKTKIDAVNTVIINKLLEQYGFNCQAFINKAQTSMKPNKHCYLFFAIYQNTTGLLFLKPQFSGNQFLLNSFRDLNKKYSGIFLIPFKKYYDRFLTFNQSYQLTYKEYNLLNDKLLAADYYQELEKEVPKIPLYLTNKFDENTSPNGSTVFNISVSNLTKINCSLLYNCNADIEFNSIIPIEFNQSEDRKQTYIEINNVSFSNDFLKINMLPEQFQSAITYFKHYIKIFKILLSELTPDLTKQTSQFDYIKKQYSWINSINI